MTFQPWICFLYCLSFYLVVCQNISGSNICMTPDSTSIRCCKDFYLKENKCIECEPGYVGTNCSTLCPSGYFGSRCSERCQCSSDMYCEPTRGCLCNTTSVKCTQSEQEVTEPSIKPSIFSTVYQTNQNTRTEYPEKTIVSISVIVLAVLIIGTVCIRMWYTKTKKRRKDEVLSPHSVADVESRTQRSPTEGLDMNDTESFEVYNRLTLRVNHQHPSVGHTETLTAGGSPPYYLGPTLDESSQQRKNKYHVNRFTDGTVSKRNNVELQTHIVDVGKNHDQNTEQKTYIYSTPSKHTRKQLHSNNSKQKQQTAGRKTLKPKLPEPVHDTILHQQNSSRKLSTCSNGTHEEELYANSYDMEYSNRCLKRDNSLAENSNENFEARYDGKITMSFNQTKQI